MELLSIRGKRPHSFDRSGEYLHIFIFSSFRLASAAATSAWAAALAKSLSASAKSSSTSPPSPSTSLAAVRGTDPTVDGSPVAAPSTGISPSRKSYRKYPAGPSPSPPATTSPLVS